MILQNNTRVSNKVVRAVLSAGARAVRCPTSGTVVQVNTSRRGSHGMAWDYVSIHFGGKLLACPHGAFKITLSIGFDPLESAEQFFSVASHEWSHIRDYRAGGRQRLLWSSRTPTGRRQRHDDRPEERRASSREADAMVQKNKWADEILVLAQELEPLCPPF